MPHLTCAEADGWVDVPCGEFPRDIGNIGHRLSGLEHEHGTYGAPRSGIDHERFDMARIKFPTVVGVGIVHPML